MMDVKLSHEQEQKKNLGEAREKMDDWIQCILKADVNNRDAIFKEAVELLLAKAEADADLNERISIAIRFVNLISLKQ